MKSTVLFLSIVGTLTGALMSTVAVSDTGTLVNVSKLVANDSGSAAGVWEQDIEISETGIYSLLVDEVAGSLAAGQLSAALVAGDRTYIRAEDGVASPGIALPVGRYKLYVSYSVPPTAPWITIKSTLAKDSTVYATQLNNIINDSLAEGDRVLQFDLEKDRFLPGTDVNTQLRIHNITPNALSRLDAQIIDSDGITSMPTNAVESEFTFDEDAVLLLHAHFAGDEQQALLNIELAGKAVGADELVTVLRNELPQELERYDTQQLKIPVVPGVPISVSLRGVNLGTAPDDMGVLVTTLAAEQTYRFTQSDFSDGSRAEVRTFSPENDHLYVASYVEAGDMAVVVSIKTESGELLREELLTGKQIMKLGEFDKPSPGQYVISLKDLQFPVAFNAISVAAISADVALPAESVATSSAIKNIERTVTLGASKYHVVAVSDIDDAHSGTFSFSIMNGLDSAFETVNTLGKHSIPAEPFELAYASEIQVKLHDHEFPAKIDSLSVGLMTKDGMLPGGNSSVEHSLPAGKYYLAVAARSTRPGIYNLSASATDSASVTPTPGEGEVPPRGVAGSGGKKGGGGSVGAFFLLVLGAFSVYRRKFA